MKSQRLMMTPPMVQECAIPRRWPHLVFSAEGASGTTKRPTLAARILIVEDEFLVAFQLEGALKDAGYDVVGIASSAEEALRLAEAARPALVLMDIRLMGTRDGIDAALELFREYGIRCIFASAHQDKDARSRAEPARPLAWLPKPYSMAALVETVQAALAKVRDDKQG
jgi:DNA-binding NarL/FixJ family response regulator